MFLRSVLYAKKKSKIYGGLSSVDSIEIDANGRVTINHSSGLTDAMPGKIELTKEVVLAIIEKALLSGKPFTFPGD
jgi:hypothetical protein